MTHAKRVMDKNEIDTVTKLYEEFKSAIDGSEGKILPEDSLGQQSLDVTKVRSVLKRAMSIKKDDGNQLSIIPEEGN